MERKRQLWAVVAICIGAVFCPVTWGQFGGGGGTASDPYLIYTAEHLKAIRTRPGKPGNYVHYKLKADIDLKEVTMTPMGTEAAPLVIVVDGDGRTISNLKIALSSGDNVGLFGYTNAEVRDLTLIDVEVTAPNSKAVGALAGTWAGGKVERCFVKGGTVTGKDEVGGLVGHGNTLIHQCSTSCSVSGQYRVGGLSGVYRGYDGVSQCYSTASVSGKGLVGGLVGDNQQLLRDCYATGEVQGNSGVYGLAGGTNSMISNCYAAGPVGGKSYVGGLSAAESICCSSFWDTQVSGPTSVSRGIGKTTDELRMSETFRGWGRGAAWTIEEGKDYPRLAWENRPGAPLETRAFPESQGQGTKQEPYLIRTAQELNAIGDFAAEWDRHYRLESDIDMAGLNEPTRIIGRYQFPFTGVFDGNGHSISNFTYPFLETCAGLFGATERAVIKRLTLVNPRLEQGSSSRHRRVAPLIGQQIEGTVEACGVDGGVVSAGHTVGGLVGLCYAGTIRQCYSTCKALSWTDAENIGGLVGWGNRCNVNNCYAGGQASGIKSVGGLIGRMEEGNVSHCYAAGPVRKATNSGGLIGLATKTFATACFWDTLTTGHITGTIGTGAPTADLQKAATFINAGWDFVGEHKNGTADLWSIDEGRDYPRFTPEPPSRPECIWVDDFEDGEPLPLWQVYEPMPSVARMREANGRLGLDVPSGPGNRTSAARLSSGWALKCSQDFNLKVDFHFAAVGEGEAWVSIGLTPDLTTPVGRRVELTAGCIGNEPVHVGNRADGFGFGTWWTARGCDNGTLYLSYDAAGDELYLSYTGYGPVNAWRTVTGLLQGYWAGRPVYVVLGGSSEGMALTGEEASLDNFAVDVGSVIP